MKRISLLFAIVFFFTHLAYAQVPQGIPYQAAARNASGQALVNTAVKVRFSILDSVATGTVVYKETHSTTTNTLGLFNVNVGMGTPVTGTFSAINWGTNAKFMQMELDITGTGSSYVDMGTQQMLSVPYALYAGSTISSNTTNSYVFNSQSRLGYSTSGTWTCPAGVTQITVELWGAGGGGGGSSMFGYTCYTGYFGNSYCMGYGYVTSVPPNNAFSTSVFYSVIGGNGGRGSYRKQMVNVTPGVTYNIIVGGGGSGGNGGHVQVNGWGNSAVVAETQATNGVNGGATSFDTVVATGGIAGTAGYAPMMGSFNMNSYASAARVTGVNGANGVTYNATGSILLPNNTKPRTYVPIGYYLESNQAGSYAFGGIGGPMSSANQPNQVFDGNSGQNGEDGFCVISY